MKKLITLVFTFALSSFLLGQSVLEIPAAETDGTPIINALIKYVVADTNAQGKQAHDIYKLQRGKTYFYNQGPIFKNPITLIADEPGITDETKPPKIILTTNDAGEAPGEYCMTTFADLTVKNIAFSTTTVEGAYSWANAILLQADSLKIVLEGCHFELIGWAMLEFDNIGTKLFIDKCHVRNGTVLGSGDEWCPFFLECNSGIDSLVIRNSTFFNLQGTVVNIEAQSPVKSFIFDHNTLVNVVKGFSSVIHAHLNSKITNNIFYNVSTHSVKKAEIETGTDKINDGVVTADTLMSNLPGSTLPFVMAEKDRAFTLKNNAYFFTKSVTDYWAHYDSVEAVEWLDARAQRMFSDKTNYPKFVSENNVNIDPGFKNFGGTDDMVAQMYSHRDNGTFGFWGWDPDSTLYPDVHWAFMQWPLPEDFSYTASLTSTDGYHVGSLEYYPTELKEYEKNLTAVEDYEGVNIPQEFTLNQNYPNPFNPVTKIVYSIPRESKVQLEVFDILGRKVASLINEVKQAGRYTVEFNASKLSSGVYVYQLSTPNQLISKKMMLIK